MKKSLRTVIFWLRYSFDTLIGVVGARRGGEAITQTTEAPQMVANRGKTFNIFALIDTNCPLTYLELDWQLV